MRGAGEPAIRDERHGFAEACADYVARRRQHLLHPRPALRPLIPYHHHMARLHLAAKYAFTRLFLGVEAYRLAGEAHHGRRDAALLHYRPSRGQVSPQHGESAVLRICVVQLADYVIVADLRRLDELPDGLASHRLASEVQQLGRQSLQNRHYAARTIKVCDMVVSARSKLAYVRGAGRKLVHALKREVHASLPRYRKRVQDGVRGAAHRHVERNGVVQRFRRHEVAGLRAALLRHLHDALRGEAIQILPLRIDRKDRAVARQRYAKRLVEAVHGVGREHAGARSAAGA